jgi:RES domain-containing protein
VILWRISNYADLKGIGGLQTAGRWHNRGIPVVYLAENPALAMLEVLVRFELAPDEVPVNYQLLEVDYPQRKSIARLQPRSLPRGWQDDLELTRAVGDEWLASASSALLRVPSAIVPRSFNYLFNPRHPEARLAQVISATRHPYDARLMAG